MIVKNLIEELSKLDGDLPVISLDTSSGVSQEISGASFRTHEDNGMAAGALCDFPDGANYCVLYLDY